MSEYPDSYRYTKEHEWAAQDGNRIRIGITPYAVSQLGDVTLVDLPDVGTAVSGGERFGDIESVKTVSELFAPVSGTIVEVNHALEEEPEGVNDSPYEQGWMVVIEASDPSEYESLLDSESYKQYLAGLEE